MLMRIWGVLNGKEDNLVKDLKETTLSFKKLGKKYGVSRQAIHNFSRRQGIKRPLRPKGHQTEGCRLCQKLIQIGKKPYSEFISLDTIQKQMESELSKRCLYHLRIVRARELVNQKFGRLRSRRVEKAYAIYFTERLSIRAIGRKVGLKNFPAVIKKHRELGWSVPPSLYVYNGRERSRIKGKAKRMKHR